MVLDGGRRALHTVTWRAGSKGPLRSRFAALRVRPAGVRIRRAYAGEDLPVCWLLAEWPPGESEPTKYWLSTLEVDIALWRLVRLAKIRWRIEHDYRELKTGLGWTISRAVPGAVGTITSLWSRSRTPFAPCSGSTQKPWLWLEHLPGHRRVAIAPGLLGQGCPTCRRALPRHAQPVPT
ncbi:hypothetical protein [Streptosporangium subroseum]|uniref:hypothetical protein n=1 Tax=Streptosporangium subroseum TaxID=106412 RepID=UPI00308868AC|nr:hypothetical protein OHB15_18690 [Streptosporangium subroseum]